MNKITLLIITLLLFNCNSSNYNSINSELKKEREIILIESAKALGRLKSDMESFEIQSAELLEIRNRLEKIHQLQHEIAERIDSSKNMDVQYLKDEVLLFARELNLKNTVVDTTYITQLDGTPKAIRSAYAKAVLARWQYESDYEILGSVAIDTPCP